MNKHEVARYNLLPMLSRYRRMSESVHHDEQYSSLHCRKCFPYDEQRSSFHTEGLNSQNTNESEFLMKSDTLICLRILVFPIGIIEVSTSRKYSFWLYFSSLHDYWPPSTWNSLVHTAWGEMERCEKRAFQHLKMRKKKINGNIKTKCVTDI